MNKNQISIDYVKSVADAIAQKHYHNRSTYNYQELGVSFDEILSESFVVCTRLLKTWLPETLSFKSYCGLYAEHIIWRNIHKEFERKKSFAELLDKLIDEHNEDLTEEYIIHKLIAEGIEQRKMSIGEELELRDVIAISRKIAHKLDSDLIFQMYFIDGYNKAEIEKKLCRSDSFVNDRINKILKYLAEIENIKKEG